MEKSGTTIHRQDKPSLRKVTLFLPTSRRWRVEPMAKQLHKLDRDGFEIDVIVVIDNSDISEAYVQNMFAKHEAPNISKIISTGNPGASEGNAHARRERITNVWKLAKTAIPEATQLVFTIEDDTDISANTLQALVGSYDVFTAKGVKVGLISGIQVGRWGLKMIGAWKTDNIADPTTWETVPFTRKEILSEVDAAGFYCFITPRELFCSANYIFNDFGADVNYGWEVRKKGYRNFIDWTLPCGHVMQHKTLLPDESVMVCKYQKIDGKWKLIKPVKGEKLS